MINAERLVSRNGHLEIFSLPQITENSRQHLLLRTDIFPKTVVVSIVVYTISRASLTRVK